MTVVIPEEVSMILYRYGFYEEGLTWVLLNTLKPGMTFLDIGSHFGYFSLLASHLVTSSGQVHSFEPIPSTFQILQSNLAAKDNVTLNPFAVFREDGNVTIHDYGVQFSAFNSIYEPRLPLETRNSLRTRTYTVPCLSLDSYVKSQALLPDFVKIDAESAEQAILMGMKETLRKARPILSLEVGDFEVQGSTGSSSLIRFLEDFGYEAFQIAQQRLNRLPPTSRPTGYDNLIFVPKTRP